MGIDQEINAALTQPTDLTCQGKQEVKGGSGGERGCGGGGGGVTSGWMGMGAFFSMGAAEAVVEVSHTDGPFRRRVCVCVFGGGGGGGRGGEGGLALCCSVEKRCK